MKGILLNRILFIGFILNLLLIATLLAQIIVIITNPDLFVKFYDDYYIVINTVFTFLSGISLFFFIYNIIFLYKYDRYSKSLIPLLIFNVIYAPYYYYKVKIKGRKLDNEMKVKSVLGDKINLETYENEDEFYRDLKV